MNERKHRIRVLVNDAEMGPLISYLTKNGIPFVYGDTGSSAPKKEVKPPQAPNARTPYGSLSNVVLEFFKEKKTYERIDAKDVIAFVHSKGINSHNIYRTLNNFARNGMLAKHRDGTFSRKTESGNIVYVATGNIRPDPAEKKAKVYRKYEVPWRDWMLNLFLSAPSGATFTPDQVAEAAAKAGRNATSARLMLWNLEADGEIINTVKNQPRHKAVFRLA